MKLANRLYCITQECTRRHNLHPYLRRQVAAPLEPHLHLTGSNAGAFRDRVNASPLDTPSAAASSLSPPPHRPPLVIARHFHRRQLTAPDAYEGRSFGKQTTPSSAASPPPASTPPSASPSPSAPPPPSTADGKLALDRADDDAILVDSGACCGCGIFGSWIEGFNGAAFGGRQWVPCETSVECVCDGVARPLVPSAPVIPLRHVCLVALLSRTRWVEVATTVVVETAVNSESVVGLTSATSRF